MKKSINLVVLLALVLGMTISCKKDANKDASLSSISIKPATLLQVIDDTTRLTAVLEPSNAVASLEWKSSNEDVATVSDNGTVIAIGEGNCNITCTDSKTGLSATCAVTVTIWEKTVQFTQCFLWDYDVDSTDIESKYYTYEDDEWGELKVIDADMSLLLFSEGFYYNASGYLDGAKQGAIVEWPTTCMIATVADNPTNTKFKAAMGSSTMCGWVLGAYKIDAENDSDNHVVLPGEISDEPLFVATLQDAITSVFEGTSDYAELLQDADTLIANANIAEYTYDCYDSDCGYYGSYLRDGIVTDGYVYTAGEDGSSMYMSKIDYSEMSIKYFNNNWIDHIWGIELIEQDSTYEFGDKIDYIDVTYKYGTDPRASEKPRRSTPMLLPQKDDANWLAAKKDLQRQINTRKRIK